MGKEITIQIKSNGTLQDPSQISERCLKGGKGMLLNKEKMIIQFISISIALFSQNIDIGYIIYIHI
jgi:hypothetical protein